MARQFVIDGRTFSKVADARRVHVVEDEGFWHGDKSWEHRAVCGASISGTPVTFQTVDCKGCRQQIEALKVSSLNKRKAGSS